VKRLRVAVAGAGIAGLSVAHALARRGASVVVVAPDGGATAAGAGIASVHFGDPALRALAERSLAILGALTPLRRVGMAQVALSRRAAAALDGVAGVRRGLPPRLAAAFHPRFLDRVVAATFSPRDAWLALPALLAALARGGRRVRERAVRVVDRGLLTRSGLVEADRVVLATGAWARRRLGDEVSLRRAECARADVSLPAMFHVVDTGLYARPEGAGSLAGARDAPRAGAPRGPVQPTRRAADAIARELASVVGRPVRAAPASAGVLAFARDGRPIVAREGRTWIVAGFGGDGLALAPAIGERVADEVMASR
jgi:glycine/D-amino acid oxidase-like deaminating enzyme